MYKHDSLPEFMSQSLLLPNYCVRTTKKNGKDQIGLFTLDNIQQHETLFHLEGKIIESPTKYTIQINKNKHIEDKHVGYMNHSCDPNTQLYNLTMVAIRFIPAGQELTFNYNQTEDQLISPFKCSCCGQRIEGKLLSKEVLI